MLSSVVWMFNLKDCTYPEVPCFEVSVGDFIVCLQHTKIKCQDVLDLLTVNMS